MTRPFLPTLLLLLLCTGFGSCSSCNEEENGKTGESITTDHPDFNPDSAYSYIQKQLSFGPRVPGTPAHRACAGWMQTMLKQFTDTVYRQETVVTAGNGKALPCINLIGSINPGAQRRILLLAHWDSRPWADMDTRDTNKPIPAADDGASGVAVLLELARQIQTNRLPAHIGVDILFTDVEDYGRSEWGDESYALGTQYWARHPHIAGYKAESGILLDMVGARGAKFPLEGISYQLAPAVQQRVWEAAGRAGFSSYFIFQPGGMITDDHVFVNQLAGIPTIDIIHLDPGTGNFAPHWHTHADDLPVIDKATLEAVGETLLQFLYETASSDA